MPFIRETRLYSHFGKESVPNPIKHVFFMDMSDVDAGPNPMAHTNVLASLSASQRESAPREG